MTFHPALFPYQTLEQTENTMSDALISETSRAEIDHWLTKYPADQKQSAVMGALMAVQKQNGGWLTQELMDAVADYLDMPPIAVYEVATFYSMYEHKPVGKHKICVCTNVSCMLRGSDEIVSHLENKLGIKMGEMTPDGKFSLKEVECLAACGNAPMFQVGEAYHEDLTPEKVDEILAKLD
jgi:NADH-quinone oxidoreductase subunit E